MNWICNTLLGHFDRSTLQREVEEEFKFHINMQAQDYEREGLAPEESLAKAKQRFGDFARVKSECIEIGLQNSARHSAMKVLFTMAFFLGVVIRGLSSEFRVTRIGDVLIMIAVSGGLLMAAKKVRTRELRQVPEPIRLGLHSSADCIPPAFDEHGRTPFERVRSNDE